MEQLGLTTGVLSIVTGLIFLLVGIVIGAELIDPINASLGAGGTTGPTFYTAANATDGMTAAWGIYDNAMSGLTIAGVALIIIGAAVILSVMLGFGGSK